MGTMPVPRSPRWLWVTLAVLLVIVSLIVGGAAWLWHSDAAFRWLLGRVPGLEAVDVQGRPTGGALGIGRLAWQRDGLRIEVDGLSWRDANWRWRPHPGAWIGVELDTPQARVVKVTTAPKPDAPKEPARAPDHLRLPVAATLRGLRIGALHLNAQPPLTGLQADVQIGADEGAVHRLQGVTLARDGVTMRLDASVASGAPMPVTGSFAVETDPNGAPQWHVNGRLDGTVPRLRMLAEARQASARVGADATIAPFAAWPLAGLTAQLRDVDLSAFSAALPATTLSGRAVVGGGAAASDATTQLDLSNDAPGPWDARRLPVRTLVASLRGLPGDAQGITFERVEAALEGAAPAGMLRLGGRWQGDALQVDGTLADVRPSLLDTRAPAMTVSGPVKATLRGLGAAPGAAAASAPLAGDVTVTLQGRTAATRSLPVRLAADAAFERSADQALQLHLRRLDARAGEAGAMAQAEGALAADGAWRLQTRGELARFDPGVWLPAIDPRRRGSALNGRWDATLAGAPGGAQGVASGMAASLAALRGQASLKLDDSRIVGLPLRGAASMAATAQQLEVDADLQAGNARLKAQGRLPTDAAARPDARVDVKAPSLATFAPLMALAPASLAAWLPTRGALDVAAAAQGRWPALAVNGTLSARDLQGAAVRAGRVDARWTVSTADPDAPLDVMLDATGLAQGERRLDRVQVRADGTLRSHRVRADVASPLRPPAWAETMAGTPQPGGSRWELDLRGAWAPQAAGGGTWRGAIAQLLAAPRSGGEAWLRARELDATVVLDAGGRPSQAQLAPGRIALLGGGIRWQAARWQPPAAPGAAPRMALDAVVEPLRVAPWLARLQPQFGWRGDFALGARIRVDSAERFDADMVVERSGGDLGLTVNGTPRTLGLTELRLGLAAHGGTWQVTQALAGKQLGALSGTQSLRTAPDAVVPAPDAAIDGRVELRIPDLAVWAPWLPSGWRIGGKLQAAASLGGRVNAPTWRGRIDGDGIEAHQLFDGIHLQDGTLAVALRGDDAAIERLEFKDGARAGTLRIDGNARFGDTPRTQLRAVASQFRVLDRVDRHVTVSGSADVSVQGPRVRARGNFEVDHGLIDVSQSEAPSLDGDIVVVNDPHGDATAQARIDSQPPGAGRPAGEQAGALAQADVEVQVDLGKALRLRGRGIDAILQGRLRASTERSRLGVFGNVRIVEGTYKAYRQNLSIERGVLSFAGDVANPRLDVLAIRPDIDTRVGVIVSGTAVAPRVRLYSEPDLPDIDKLTWLVMGRGPEGVGQADTALLQRAALALLSGDKTEDEGFLERLGIDSLSVRRAESGSTADTVLGVGKQLSRRLYVGYERALAGAGGSWQLIYRIAQLLTVRAQAGDENTVDVIWTWRWE